MPALGDRAPGESVEAEAGAISVELGEASDAGRDPNKQVNEDCCGHARLALGHLFVVCDGMGGHAGGRQASETAVAAILAAMAACTPQDDPRRRLVAAVEEAGRRVYAVGGVLGPHEGRPGSTCVALLLHRGRVEVAHVGDSRAYAVRGGQIFRLTKDHSVVQGLVDKGMLPESDALRHPEANKITRALGMRPSVEVELRSEPMELFAADVLVLCTDGLTDLVPDQDMLEVCRQSVAGAGPQVASEKLVALANQRGGHDNISVQVVKVVNPGPKSSVTLAGVPGAASATLAMEPTHEDGPLRSALPATAPDRPPPTVIDEQAGAPPPVALPPPPLPPLPPQVSRRGGPAARERLLVGALVALAALVILLAIALAWALLWG
ncbi:MAG: serine/threonine-protein phosphatase [Deltaproteobacteria bacterium]|nr:serine/threonine-protein phosphatase [Deltaproteobacteria bacterium]